MCSTYVGFEVTPELLEEMKKSSTMYWCRSCKKTFMKKESLICPNCGSDQIKPRAL